MTDPSSSLQSSLHPVQASNLHAFLEGVDEVTRLEITGHSGYCLRGSAKQGMILSITPCT
jgi:hypothetical protein